MKNGDKMSPKRELNLNFNSKSPNSLLKPATVSIEQY